MKLFILISLISVMLNGNNARIPVVNFNDFEPRLHLINDTTYVINFWASWCAPCKEELPDFEKLHRDYRTDKIKVLLMSLDMPAHVESRLIPLLDSYNITADVILLDDPDFNSWISKIDSTWGGAIPATLIYSKEKRVFLNRKTHYEELVSIVKPNK